MPITISYTLTVLWWANQRQDCGIGNSRFDWCGERLRLNNQCADAEISLRNCNMRRSHRRGKVLRPGDWLRRGSCGPRLSCCTLLHGQAMTAPAILMVTVGAFGTIRVMRAL